MVSDFRQSRSNTFGQLGWGGGFIGVRDTDFVFLHSHWIFVDTTVFKANSCEKFEAKISEKSEKKGKRILEANKRISCETDLCSLTIRFEAKKIFKRNGLTLAANTSANCRKNLKRP
jgi:hypothetical protein